MEKEIIKIEKLKEKILQADKIEGQDMCVCTKTIKNKNNETIFKKDKIYTRSIRRTLIGIGGIYYDTICETGESLKISNLGKGLLNYFFNLEDLEKKLKWLKKLEKEGVSQINLFTQDFTNAKKYKVTIKNKEYDSYGIYTVTPEGNSCVFVPKKNIILEEYHMTNPSKEYCHKPKKELNYILE
jgi:hypothetical protein